MANHLADDRYCIKNGYRSNLVQITLDSDEDNNYWNAERLSLASSFQYDVYRMAVDLLRDRRRGTLLDVGSGPPLKLQELLPSTGIAVHLVDQPSTESLAARLLPDASFTGANLESIEINLGKRFDVIVCADVIEHLIDPDSCLAFIRRHIRQDGIFLISTPERDLLRGPEMTYSPHPMHVREWNAREFAAFLGSRGWLVESQHVLPQQRCAKWRRAFGKLRHQLGLTPNWYSCQLAVCRLP
ncbi:MAG: class I SAM-dependent methyltransferase [Propionivibrio sp.]|nr:class I SAM-dependent methyltransferase [Propionivibrio sp.]